MHRTGRRRHSGLYWLKSGARGPKLLLADVGVRANPSQHWIRINNHSGSSITQLLAVRGSGVVQVVGVGLNGLRPQRQDVGASFKTEVRPDHLGLTAAVMGAQARRVPLPKHGWVHDPAKP